ncbi:MAG: ferritin [Phycisphaerales bacterium]
MLHEEVREALNEQINLEFESAYLYLAMSSHYDEMNLPGFASWMRVQAKEEVEHAMRIYDFVHDRGDRVTLGAIAGPTAQFGSVKDVVRQALAHEQKVTQRIHALYQLAAQHNDLATQTHLHWFIEEQVEEEKIVGDVLARIELTGDAPAALIVLDKELGQRSGD